MMISSGNVTFFDGWENIVIINITANYMSMTIMSLQFNDSGEYRLQKPNRKFSIMLSIQGEVVPMFLNNNVFFYVMSSEDFQVLKCEGKPQGNANAISSC